MTADNVHIHLRNTKCQLHRLAEHYQKALLTYYTFHVKSFGHEDICMPITPIESNKPLNQDPLYHKTSPFVTDTGKTTRT